VGQRLSIAALPNHISAPPPGRIPLRVPEPEYPRVTRTAVEELLLELDPTCDIATPCLVVGAAFMGCRRTPLHLAAKTRSPYSEVVECLDRLHGCGLWRDEYMCFESDPDDDAAVIEFWLHVLVAGGELTYIPADATYQTSA
jgi:hypothetical protein